MRVEAAFLRACAMLNEAYQHREETTRRVVEVHTSGALLVDVDEAAYGEFGALEQELNQELAGAEWDVSSKRALSGMRCA